MQKLLKEISDVEKDLMRNGEVHHAIYDSIITDFIMMEWEGFDDPWTWIQSDPLVAQSFYSAFNANMTEFSNIQLYRGTDYVKFYDLKQGDILDYGNRYTSWSRDVKIASHFTEPGNPLILSFKGSANLFHVKTNRMEDELIINPSKFIVTRVILLDNSDVLDLVEEEYHNNDGRIIELNRC